MVCSSSCLTLCLHLQFAACLNPDIFLEGKFYITY